MNLGNDMENNPTHKTKAKKPELDRTVQHKKAIIEALEQSLGVVTTACKKVNVSRTQYYIWLKEDKEFADAVNDIDNIALDFAESQLHKQIKEGNTTATIFFLKTKGHKRGYVERQEIKQEITNKDIDLNSLSDAELNKLIAIIGKAESGKG
jgi:hypothetical protein